MTVGNMKLDTFYHPHQRTGLNFSPWVKGLETMDRSKQITDILNGCPGERVTQH